MDGPFAAIFIFVICWFVCFNCLGSWSVLERYVLALEREQKGFSNKKHNMSFLKTNILFNKKHYCSFKNMSSAEKLICSNALKFLEK